MAADLPLRSFEDRVGHRFGNVSLLQNALTHPSAPASVRADANGPGYEQLEFLGDRALGLAVVELLMERFPKEDEGALSKRHTALVRKEALIEIAREIKLDGMLRQAPGGGRAHARQKETALADGVEALIGAMFLDGGYLVVRAFVRAWWPSLLDRFAQPPKDPKTSLQEWAQGRGLPLPRYEVTTADGPAHAPRFEITVRVDGQAACAGEGRSKRQAEQAAATALLRQLGEPVS